ncbi:mechanosensitive ion channel domain-containing protein [Alkalihalobacterium sp. APHAB7]|uniref:mechanosensitive ion channel domain-containing protein n=1 Tax=Alkalihalobacterium sp. APHAB7 TaxID=3402081 RepID=UPI003AAF6F34
MIWSEARLDLTIYIGFISAGLAIALREIFTNIAALIIIVLQKPFEVGDRIYLNNSAGDVIDQKMFHFVKI